MSAFVVSQTHIDALVSAGLVFPNQNTQNSNLRWRETPEGEGPYRAVELTYENADSVGAMLWAENVASVDYRYPDATDENRPGPAAFEGTDTLLYQHRMIPGRLDPVVVLKAIECYKYNSCEHPGWRTSQARRFCEALVWQAIHRLPGYDKAPWSFNDRRYFMGRS